VINLTFGTIIKSISLCLIFTSLYGCAGVGIPESSNPIEKIQWADNAIRSGRAGIAEKLLKEAIPMLEQEKNWGMLSRAYNVYGLLEYHFPGNKDKTYYHAIMNFNKSLDYFEIFLAEKGLDKNDRFYTFYHQWATNSAFSLGELYQVNKNYKLSCYFFDKSLKYYNEQLELKPDADLVAVGFKSFQEAIDKNKEWANCNDIDQSPDSSTIEDAIIKTNQALFDETYPKAVKKDIKDSEIEYYLKQLSSSEISERISFLKTIFKKEITDNKIFSVINKMLAGKNVQEDIPYIEADEISWLCKALASSGRIEYRDTIAKVYESATNKKIKGYAKESLYILENFAIKNRDVIMQESSNE
jgi:hypothetical protein